MATVTKPLALNESLNSTENTPRNIADVLADELDGIKQAINNQSGSGNGHIIQNSSGANMPSENTMQFVDAHLSDDSVGGKTVVETFKAVTEAEYSSETEDGAYIITDGDGTTIGPASEDYVEVVADGVKTYATLLNELWALIDSDKINPNMTFATNDGQRDYLYTCQFIRPDNNGLNFTRVDTDGKTLAIVSIRSSSSSSKSYKIDTDTTTDNSSTVFPIGYKFKLYYGNKKAVVDLQTTANRCLMSNGNNVEDTIKKISLPVTAASGITLDINDLVQMNGIVFGTLEIEASSNWATGSWAEIGQISNYSNDKLIMAMAWDTSNGNYFGMVRIESNGSVKVYPKISTKYCQVRF